MNEISIDVCSDLAFDAARVAMLPTPNNAGNALTAQTPA